MAIDYERLLNWPVPKVRQQLTKRDAILYAVGVGLGHDPMDRDQLRFVYERDLCALPSMATVLGHPGFWMKEEDTGVDWVRIVHGEQGFRIHRPLPVEGSLLGVTEVKEIVDKGRGKGALVYQERKVTDQATGDLLCTLTMTTFCRGDGGFGGPAKSTKTPHAIPERPPDRVCDLPTLPQAAMIYRLSGDDNPIHVDPDVAREAGFDRPILHGLGTLGVAGHAILKTVCDYQPEKLVAMNVRFSAPVYPGETIRTEMWLDGNVVSFRSRCIERGPVVLSNGRAELDG